MFTQPADLAKFLKAKMAVKNIEDYSSDNLPDFMQAIANKLNAAFYKYEFNPYHVKITIFKAAKDCII